MLLSCYFSLPELNTWWYSHSLFAHNILRWICGRSLAAPDSGLKRTTWMVTKSPSFMTWTVQLQASKTPMSAGRTITLSNIPAVWTCPSGVGWFAAGATLRCVLSGVSTCFLLFCPLNIKCASFLTLQLHHILSLPQVYIQTQGAPSLSLSISRDEYPNAPLVLRGINSQGALSQQYQPILMMTKSYTLHWSGPAPREVVLSLINFDKWAACVCARGNLFSLWNKKFSFIVITIIRNIKYSAGKVSLYFLRSKGNGSPVWCNIPIFPPFSFQRWLGAGGTLLPIRHHISDHGWHQW